MVYMLVSIRIRNGMSIGADDFGLTSTSVVIFHTYGANIGFTCRSEHVGAGQHGG